MTRIPYAELHAFPDGDRPHTGNPAGVALLERFLDDADLLGVARSNNLSETAFLVASESRADVWTLRWFTPGQEVDLCGHATLAAGVWLFEEGRVEGGSARFETRSGPLTVTRGEAGYVMNFPEVGYAEAKPDPAAAAAMGRAPAEAFDLPPIHGAPYQLFLYENEAAVAGLDPDFAALKRSGHNILATARGEASDIVSRFFCPACGIDEDPVTGSAHCTLAPFWAERLRRARLSARQVGPRPGALTVTARDDGRVELAGTARRFLDGTLRL